MTLDKKHSFARKHNSESVILKILNTSISPQSESSLTFIKSGDPLKLKFDISGFSQKKYTVKIDTKIYNSHGRLIHFLPEIISYASKKAGLRDRFLKASLNIKTKRNLPTGIYRIIVEVREEFSHAASNFQFKFRVKKS